MIPLADLISEATTILDRREAAEDRLAELTRQADSLVDRLREVEQAMVDVTEQKCDDDEALSEIRDRLDSTDLSDFDAVVTTQSVYERITSALADMDEAKDHYDE